MQRRAPRQEKKGHATSAHPANHCRALVPVDGTHIRKKIKKDYEKALRDLDNARGQLDQFHQTDLPEFTRWLNTHFGALLTEIRELGQKLAADEELVFQVENEVMFEGGTYARAYQRVMAFRENPEPPPNPRPGDGDPDGEQSPFGGEDDSANPDGEKDPLDELFEQLFGEFGPGGGSGERRRPGAGQRTAPVAPAHTAGRLKELYRALVRRLHPDHQRDLTPQKIEWWHQTQAAYEAGDVEQLEVILTLCEIGDSGTTAHTSASLLQRITANLKNSLREIKRQLNARRRDPAWNFSRSSDHDTLAVRIRREMTEDLQRMRAQWREARELIERWKAAAEHLKPSRGRKRRRESAEFPF